VGNYSIKWRIEGFISLVEHEIMLTILCATSGALSAEHSSLSLRRVGGCPQLRHQTARTDWMWFAFAFMTLTGRGIALAAPNDAFDVAGPIVAR
jgi:hypothetical protein